MKKNIKDLSVFEKKAMIYKISQILLDKIYNSNMEKINESEVSEELKKEHIRLTRLFKRKEKEATDFFIDNKKFSLIIDYVNNIINDNITVEDDLKTYMEYILFKINLLVTTGKQIDDLEECEMTNELQEYIDNGIKCRKKVFEDNLDFATLIDQAYKNIVENGKTKYYRINNGESKTQSDRRKVEANRIKAYELLLKELINSDLTITDFCKMKLITRISINNGFDYMIKHSKNSDYYQEAYINLMLKESSIVKNVEEFIKYYDPKEKNLSLLEYYTITNIKVKNMCTLLNEHKSKYHKMFLSFYYAVRDTDSYMKMSTLRNTRIIINGREFNSKDYDIIEKFLIDNNYPLTNGTFYVIKNYYVNGKLEEITKENITKKLNEKKNNNGALFK